MKVNLQMLVIRLTIMKCLTSICFWASSGLTEHCDSWIDNFHPSFRFVQSLQLCVWVCACTHILTPPALAKDLEPKSDSLQLKRPCWLSHVQPSQEARSSGSLSLWWGCQLPRLTPKPCSEHLVSIMFWSSCLWYFLLCSWHIWTHWIFNSDPQTCFCWIIAFSPSGGLVSDTLEWRDSLYIFIWHITYALCLISALLSDILP